jgi:Domain of unknown function (DUF4192)
MEYRSRRDPRLRLLAFVALRSRDGALANLALDRALADDPRYSGGQILVVHSVMSQIPAEPTLVP